MRVALLLVFVFLPLATARIIGMEPMTLRCEDPQDQIWFIDMKHNFEGDSECYWLALEVMTNVYARCNFRHLKTCRVDGDDVADYNKQCANDPHSISFEAKCYMSKTVICYFALSVFGKFRVSRTNYGCLTIL